MSEVANVHIIKTGQTYPHIREAFDDFEAWISAPSANLDTPSLSFTFTVHTVFSSQERLPELTNKSNRPSAIVVTGSGEMVTDNKKWMLEASQWLQDAIMGHNIPTLGICFGHQLIAKSLGGSVNFHPKGREIGTRQITLETTAKDDALFKDCPPQFDAHLTHLQSVTQLPESAVRLAYNEHEPNQAFRFGEHTWGLQFHPEFTADILKAYVNQLQNDLSAENFSVADILAKVTEAPTSQTVLAAFYRYIQQHITETRGTV